MSRIWGGLWSENRDCPGKIGTVGRSRHANLLQQKRVFLEGKKSIFWQKRVFLKICLNVTIASLFSDKLRTALADEKKNIETCVYLTVIFNKMIKKTSSRRYDWRKKKLLLVNWKLPQITFIKLPYLCKFHEIETYRDDFSQ